MKERAVSEAVGVILLIGMAVMAMLLVSLFLMSQPLPASVPHLSGIISNRSSTIYISHEGGDPLYRGQYRILVDGVDYTSSFAKSFAEPWSAGKIMNYTLDSMPGRVVMLYNASGAGEIVLLSADLSTTATAIQPYPIVFWSSSPAYGNRTTLIQFTDTSVGMLLNGFSWIYSDGSTSTFSTSKSPSYTFSSCSDAGDICVYSISHSVTDSAGTPEAATTWLNRSSWVTIYKNATPTVSFTSNKRSGLPPVEVTFTAAPAGPIAVDRYSWTFGDGSTETTTATSIKHTYFAFGVFTVSVTGTNYTLGEITSTRTNYIATPPWYSCDWLYRKNITLNGTAVDTSTKSYFPVLLSFTDSDLAARAQSDGDDILFTTSDGTTKIPHEIEGSPSGGNLIAWVNVTSLAYGANTTIYMYYGNSTVGSQQDRTHVWDSNYKGIWHLNESGSGKNNEYIDSTEGHPGTGGGGILSHTPSRITGKISYGQSFDGGDDFITMGTGCLVTDTWTIETWIRPSTPSDYDVIFLQGYGACGSRQIRVAWYDNRVQVYYVTDGSNSGPKKASGAIAEDGSTWSHLVLTHTGTTDTMYVNGVTSSGSTGGVNCVVTGNLFLGKRSDAYYWEGGTDEVRVSDNTRSGDWIKTEYTNQANPALFHYPKSEEAWTC